MCITQNKQIQRYLSNDKSFHGITKHAGDLSIYHNQLQYAESSASQHFSIYVARFSRDYKSSCTAVMEQRGRKKYRDVVSEIGAINKV